MKKWIWVLICVVSTKRTVRSSSALMMVPPSSQTWSTLWNSTNWTEACYPANLNTPAPWWPYDPTYIHTFWIKLSLHPWLRTKKMTNPVSKCLSSVIKSVTLLESQTWRTVSESFILCLWDCCWSDGSRCLVNKTTLPIYFPFSISLTSRYYPVEGFYIILQKLLPQSSDPYLSLMPCNFTWSCLIDIGGIADVFVPRILHFRAKNGWPALPLACPVLMLLFRLCLASWWVSLSGEFLCGNWITAQVRLSLSPVGAP